MENCSKLKYQHQEQDPSKRDYLQQQQLNENKWLLLLFQNGMQMCFKSLLAVPNLSNKKKSRSNFLFSLLHLEHPSRKRDKHPYTQKQNQVKHTRKNVSLSLKCITSGCFFTPVNVNNLNRNGFTQGNWADQQH